MLKVLVLVLVLLIPAQAFSNSVSLQARDQAGTVVTLGSGACTSKPVIGQLPLVNTALEQAGQKQIKPADLRAGSLIHEGRQYLTCWFFHEPTDSVVVIDDAALPDSIFLVPRSHFSVVEGI